MKRDKPRMDRRDFLLLSLTGAGAAVAGSPLLAACGAGGSAAAGKANSTDQLRGVLPRYLPLATGPKPDLPVVAGSAGARTDPGFLSYPTELVTTTEGTPGTGGSYTAITPVWGAIPPAGNAYFAAVNRALGATVTVKPANGNDYAQTVPTLVAGGKLPDWIQLPSWWNGTFNVGQLAATKFADLTPYLAGDKITKYPNLAAIPTGGWQDGAWNNRLYGIPCFTSGESFNGLLFYRKDIFDAKGINPAEVKDAQSFLALGKELTAPTANVWAFDDVWLMFQQIFTVPSSGIGGIAVRDGRAISSFDTPEQLAALEFASTLARSGYVHPDALANRGSEGTQRFASGHVLVQAGGQGGWSGQDAVAGRAANRSYVRGGLPLFSHDGSTPSIPLRSSSSVVSYLNKNLSPARIEECLAIANYLAAPFGSTEYTLVNYGVEGVHWTRGKNGPEYTTHGTKESNQQTYQFLASCQQTVSNPGNDEVTKAYCAWHADAAKYAYRPPFLDLNVVTPSRFATTSAASEVSSVLLEVTRGTKTIADFQAAAAHWKSSGGQAFIDWVQKEVIDVHGTGV